MDGMQYGDVPIARIGLGVRARIKTRRGGEHLVLGDLVEVNEEGARITAGSRSVEAASRGDVNLYPWDRVVSVEPLEARRQGRGPA